MQFVQFALILEIFYFPILMPMKRRQRKVQDFQSALKVGDRVVTTGGIYGEITRVNQAEGFDPETFYMVGAKEADPRNGKISNESPIGSALIGHKVGDVVEANTPGGKMKFKILKIE